MSWRRAARPHLRRALLLAAGAGAAAAADVDGSASGGGQQQQCSLLHKGRGFGRNLDGQHGPMRYVSSAQDCCAFCHATAGCELCESRRPIALTGWHTPTGGGRTRSFLATRGARCSSRRGQS